MPSITFSLPASPDRSNSAKASWNKAHSFDRVMSARFHAQLRGLIDQYERRTDASEGIYKVAKIGVLARKISKKVDANENVYMRTVLRAMKIRDTYDPLSKY